MVQQVVVVHLAQAEPQVLLVLRVLVALVEQAVLVDLAVPLEHLAYLEMNIEQHLLQHIHYNLLVEQEQLL